MTSGSRGEGVEDTTECEGGSANGDLDLERVGEREDLDGIDSDDPEDDGCNNGQVNEGIVPTHKASESAGDEVLSVGDEAAGAVGSGGVEGEGEAAEHNVEGSDYKHQSAKPDISAGGYEDVIGFEEDARANADAHNQKDCCGERITSSYSRWTFLAGLLCSTGAFGGHVGSSFGQGRDLAEGKHVGWELVELAKVIV